MYLYNLFFWIVNKIEITTAIIKVHDLRIYIIYIFRVGWYVIIFHLVKQMVFFETQRVPTQLLFARRLMFFEWRVYNIMYAT